MVRDCCVVKTINIPLEPRDPVGGNGEILREITRNFEDKVIPSINR